MIQIILISLLHVSAYAISEHDIIKSVIHHFPLIEEAELKYKSAKEDVTTSEGAFDHKITFKSRNRIEDKYDNQYFETSIERQTPFGGLGLITGLRQGRGNFPFYDGKYFTSGAGELFAGLTMPLLRDFQTDEYRTELQISKYKLKAQKAELEIKLNVYIHKALSLYYKHLFNNQKIKIRKEILEIAEQRQQMLEKKFKAGDIENLKVIDNQRSVDKRKDELLKTEIEWIDSKTQLEIFLKDQSGNQISLTKDLLPVDDIKPVNKEVINLSDLPQISVIDQEIKAINAKKELYEQSKLPGLKLELLGSRELSANRPYDQEALQIGIKFDIPLENRKARGASLSSEYKFLALKKQRDYLEQNLQQQYTYSHEATKLSQTRWEIVSSEYQKTLKLSQAEKTKWDQGASDLYIVNLREQDTADSEIKKWNVWYEYHQYHIDSRLFSGTIRANL
jgi:outer membrane protein TolC